MVLADQATALTSVELLSCKARLGILDHPASTFFLSCLLVHVFLLHECMHGVKSLAVEHQACQCGMMIDSAATAQSRLLLYSLPGSGCE